MRDLNFFLNRYAPVTTQLAFIEMPAAALATALDARAAEIAQLWSLPRNIGKEEVRGNLAEKIDGLFPMTTVRATKVLVSGTTSSWTAYFPNCASGGDAHSEPDFLAGSYGVRCLTIVVVEDVPKIRPGSTQFVLRDGRHAVDVTTRHGVMRQSPTRSIVVIKEGGWQFSIQGGALPFEEIERYSGKRIKDRLTVEMIERYCKHLGIDLFDVDFYSGDAYVVGGPVPPNAVVVPRCPNQL